MQNRQNTGREPEISLIIPFLNEEEGIPTLLARLNTFFAVTDLPPVEVIFVDDGSTDRSVEMLMGAKNLSFQGRVISLSKNFGSHAAIRAGILHARGNWITNTCADLQDPLDLIPRLYALCKDGVDTAWAYRRTTKAKFGERIFSEGHAWLVKKLIDSRYPDMGLDIFMINRKVKAEVDQNPEKNSSIFLQIMSLGFKQSHIYYDKGIRGAGKSKWTVAKKIKLLVDTFIAFSDAPIRFVTIMGVVLFAIGLIAAGATILRKLFVGDLIVGYTALASILLIGFGITNISLGIIAEYLWRTLDSSRKRKAYIIDSVTDMSPVSTSTHSLGTETAAVR